jgi:hypothetical protein
VSERLSAQRRTRAGMRGHIYNISRLPKARTHAKRASAHGPTGSRTQHWRMVGGLGERPSSGRKKQLGEGCAHFLLLTTVSQTCAPGAHAIRRACSRFINNAQGHVSKGLPHASRGYAKPRTGRNGSGPNGRSAGPGNPPTNEMSTSSPHNGGAHLAPAFRRASWV